MKVRVPLSPLRAALKAIAAGTLLLPGSDLVAQNCLEQTVNIVNGELRLRLVSAAGDTLPSDFYSAAYFNVLDSRTLIRQEQVALEISNAFPVEAPL